MKVLVTGGTGFIGTRLCARLGQEGFGARALVRDPAMAQPLSRQGVELMRGDLGSPESLRRAVEGVAVVYHLAAVFRRGNLSARQMWQTNVQGTRNILEAAARAGVKRFVHCSTVGVHGEIKDGLADEESPLRPGDAYQRSKLEGERIVLAHGAEGGMPVVVFRPGGVYGPGDTRFLKLFRAIKRGWFVMLGSGQVLYQLIYIDDLIDGVLLCATRDEALGRVYILTGNRPVTLNHLVEHIAAALGASVPRLRFPVAPVYLASALCEFLCRPLGVNPPLYRRRIDFFRKSRSFDVSRAKREIGFQAKTDLATGIASTAAWYRQQGYL